MRINSFTEIDNKDFNQRFFSMIKENFEKVVKFISRNKDVVNFSAHESLFYKQKNKVKLNMKIQNR